MPQEEQYRLCYELNEKKKIRHARFSLSISKVGDVSWLLSAIRVVSFVYSSFLQKASKGLFCVNRPWDFVHFSGASASNCVKVLNLTVL